MFLFKLNNVMDYKNWYKFLPLNLDLNDLIAWAQKTKSELEPIPQLWTTSDKKYYRTTAPDDLWNRANEIFPCKSQYIEPYDGLEYGPRIVFIWEYTEKGRLRCHIDGPKGHESGSTSGYPGTSSMVIPLIGGFTTWIYRDDPNMRDLTEDQREIVDQVTYYPGEIFIMKNYEYWHGGLPTDDYRMALFFFSESDLEAELNQLFAE